MNYEKAYNEALETARKINNGDGVAAPADWTVCETIFPVLREDYDDMIRGAIIDHLKDNNLTEWADWLEKQKSIDVLDKEEREFADNVDAFRKEIDAAYQRGYEEGKRQSKCKFSVGDIVKHSLYDSLYYIVKSIDLAGDYELECLNGKSGNNIAAATEDYMSLWTIKDAKPGDVLTDGDEFVIFKSNNYDPNTQYGCMFVYCSIMKNNEFWYESGGHNPTYYLPATKEQRELLFQKMHEAGYEWDDEKKELRKIEQNTWSEEDETGLGDALWAIQQAKTIAKDENDMGNIWYAENWLKSIKDRVQPKQELKKIVWSEEDKKYENIIVSILNNPSSEGMYNFHDVKRKDVINWFESLLNNC